MAMPFVQGHLRNSRLSVEIQSRCAHCDEPIHLVVDNELSYTIGRGSPEPLVFEPHVDWSTFAEPTIVDGY